MNLKEKAAAAVMAGITVAACVAILNFGLPSLASAQSATPPAQTNPPAAGNQAAPGRNGRTFVNPQQYLADALGKSLADLQAAQTAARNAEIDAAVKAGTITQSQADAIKSGQRGARYNLGITAADARKYLADALGITVGDLTSAENKAYKAELDQAVQNGRLTQAQEDLRIAERALQQYIVNNDVFTATVNQAVKDGALTQTQADAILNQAKNSRGGAGFLGPMGGFDGGFGGPMGPMGPMGGFNGGRGGPRGFGSQGAPKAPNNSGTATPQPSM
jgi:hypothetical protein